MPAATPALENMNAANADIGNLMRLICQRRCGSDADQMRLRCGSVSADAAQMRLRRGSDAAQMRLRCGSDAPPFESLHQSVPGQQWPTSSSVP